MSDPAETSSCFSPNPAIFSVGVRISCYVISILAAMAPIKSTFLQWHLLEMERGNQDVQPKQEISSVVTAQGVTGLGLLITAVIETFENQLSLYHAYLVINLLFLLSTSFLYFLSSPNPVVRRQKFYLLSLIFLAGFSLYVGLTARTFGSQPKCNNTVKIVMLPRPFTASFTWFKIFGIATFTIYMTVAIVHGLQLIFFRNRESSSASRKGLRSNGLTVLVLNLVLIGVIEATIKINNVPDMTPPTSFGEILPLVMLIVPITDVWNDNHPLLKAKLFRNRIARTHSGDSTSIPLVAP